MNCPHCGVELPAAAQFCIECGAAVGQVATGSTIRLLDTEQIVRCPACNAANPSFALFCTICGHTIAAQAPPAPTPAAVPSRNNAPPRPFAVANAPQAPSPLPGTMPPAPLAPVSRTDEKAARKAEKAARKARRAKQSYWDSVSWGIFLIGLGILFLTGSFWPGILALIGISGFFSSVGAGRLRAGLQSLLWMCGLTLLFVTSFWPGILVLVGLSVIIGSD